MVIVLVFQPALISFHMYAGRCGYCSILYTFCIYIMQPNKNRTYVYMRYTRLTAKILFSYNACAILTQTLHIFDIKFFKRYYKWYIVRKGTKNLIIMWISVPIKFRWAFIVINIRKHICRSVYIMNSLGKPFLCSI